jgi:hypothetical protein
MIKKTVKKLATFKEQYESDHAYWATKTPGQRLSALQQMRERVIASQVTPPKPGERHQRVCRIVKQSFRGE